MTTTQTTTFVTESDLALALNAAHRLESELLLTRIERLNALVREHGIPLPKDDPRLGASDGEHLAACRRVVMAAYGLLEQAAELEAALGGLRAFIGSGMEFVNQDSWRG